MEDFRFRGNGEYFWEMTRVGGDAGERPRDTKSW